MRSKDDRRTTRRRSLGLWLAVALAGGCAAGTGDGSTFGLPALGTGGGDGNPTTTAASKGGDPSWTDGKTSAGGDGSTGGSEGSSSGPSDATKGGVGSTTGLDPGTTGAGPGTTGSKPGTTGPTPSTTASGPSTTGSPDPGEPMYGPCTDGSECADGICLHVNLNPQTSYQCTGPCQNPQTDCDPAYGATAQPICIPTDQGQPVCLLECTGGASCPVGLLCIQVQTDGTSWCL